MLDLSPHLMTMKCIINSTRTTDPRSYSRVEVFFFFVDSLVCNKTQHLCSGRSQRAKSNCVAFYQAELEHQESFSACPTVSDERKLCWLCLRIKAITEILLDLNNLGRSQKELKKSGENVRESSTVT